MVDNLKILPIQTIEDNRGNLSVIENFRSFPFEISSCKFLYDLLGKNKKSYSSRSEADMFIVALSGSFVVKESSSEVYLNSPSKGILIQSGCDWSISDFSTNAAALIISAKK